MDLGIGLPNAITGTTGNQLTDWARAAEDAGFSTLGTIDRIVYPSYEPIVALSAAAAVTERIRLATDVMLGPLRQNPAMVAKQVLSLDALAGGGRAVLGIALGRARGRLRDQRHRHVQPRRLARSAPSRRIRAIWNGDGETRVQGRPPPAGRRTDPPRRWHTCKASLERAAKFGDGWTQGGAGADQFGEDLRKLDEAWKKQGREGSPQDGPRLLLTRTRRRGERPARSRRLLRLAGRGDRAGDRRQRRQGPRHRQGSSSRPSRDTGCDELILFPCQQRSGPGRTPRRGRRPLGPASDHPAGFIALANAYTWVWRI